MLAGNGSHGEGTAGLPHAGSTGPIAKPAVGPHMPDTDSGNRRGGPLRAGELVRRSATVAALVTLLLAGVPAAPAVASHDPDCNADTPANPAGSPTVWSHPQCLSVLEGDGDSPQVGIADDGSALAVWRSLDEAGTYRVQFAIRERGENGGNFVVPGPNATPAEREATFLSPPDRDVGPHIRMRMNKRGDAIVVWEQHEANGAIGVHSAYKPFDGDFGAEQLVEKDPGQTPGPGRISYVNPEVGIDGQGAATVIYNQRKPGALNTPTNSFIVSELRPPGVGSAWDDERESLVPHDDPIGEIPVVQHNDDNGVLAVDEQGNRTAVLTTQRFQDSQPEHQRVVQVERGPADNDWSESNERDTGSDEFRNTLVARRDGSSAHGHTQGDFLRAGKNTLPDFNINDSFAPNTPTSGSVVEVEPDGQALALWSDGSLLRADRAPPNSDFFESNPVAEPIPGNGAGNRTRPAVAAYGDRSAVAVFQEKVADDESVHAALRPTGGTTSFDAPVKLSQDADLEGEGEAAEAPFANRKGTGPKIAANSEGEAVAAWSIADGQANSVIQVSIMTPRDDPVIPPPQPPPPRPRPAVPNPIQLARPLARDQAVVLIANIPGSIDRLEWSFGSKDEPAIVGRVEGGELQRTVRLRLPNRSFRARVRAIGPDGTQEFARSFTALKPSSSTETREVVEGLEDADTPPVFAVGKKETLTGQSESCSPSTIWSGQQKISGCFKPIEDLVDIPSLERGAIHQLASELNLDETRRELMQKATQLTDSYVAEGRALLNDEFPVIPTNAADVVSMPQAKSLISANAELPVGSASYNPREGFNLKLDPKKATIPLGRLPNPPKLPRLGGLEIVGHWNVDLEKREAKIRASLVLPKEISKAGLKVENQVILRATPERVIVDEVRVGPIDADIGALAVRDFKIEYKRESDEWLGQARATVAGAGIDIAPPNGSVRVKDGRVVFVGATINFPTPGIPIFKGVFMEKIGFGTGFDPTRLTGRVGIGVLRIVSVDGRLVFAFPSSRTPYILRRDEIGHEFPASLEGARFTRTTIGAAGSVSVQVPAIGSVKLASGYALYEFPGYVAAGGGFDLNVLDIASLKGGISGELDVDKEAFNLHGSIQACVVDVACGSATGNISRGPNNTGGAGACIGVLGLNIGGGVQWNRLDEPFIWPFDGCKWSRFKIDVRGSAARASWAPRRPSRLPAAAVTSPWAAARTYSLEVRRGAPSPAIKLFGRGGPPRVSVRGPGGQSLSTSRGRGLDVSRGRKIRILRFNGNRHAGPFTVVGLQNAEPGRYAISPLPGSPAIVRTAQATDAPRAKVSGRVVGRGGRRVLRFRVRRRPNQRVTFQEIGPGGAARTIGITRRARGRIRFRTAPGRGRRRVVAQFELSGMPAERKLVATFRPPSMRLARPRRLRVRRRGSRVVVRWRRVRGARRYEVAASLSSRRMVFARTRRTRVVLRVPRWLSGRVTVRALDDVRQSRVAGRPRFRATRRQPSPFRPLLVCRIAGARIICYRVRGRCAGRRPTIVARPGRLTRGTRGADVIVGTSRPDRIDGRGGNDVICAGEGNDRVAGGGGRDRLLGGDGRDRMWGRSGDDRMEGGSGSDRLTGGSGSDRLIGGPGNDAVAGGAGRGRDRIDTGPGNDRIEARDEGVRDRIDCGSGRDRARVDRVDRRRRCERIRFR